MKNQKLFSVYTKKAIFALIIGASLFSTACNRVKNPLYSMKVLGEEKALVINVALKEVQSIINLEREFFFVVASKTCPACINFEPILDRYVEEKQTLVFRLFIETASDVYALQNLTNMNGEKPFGYVSDTFPEVKYTPTFMVIKNGERIYQLASSYFSNESAFRSAMSSYYNETQTYFVQSLEKLLQKIEGDSQFLISTYVGSTVGSKDEINRKILATNPKSKNNTYMIDLDYFIGAPLNITSGILQGKSFESNRIILKDKNKNIQVLDYSNSDVLNAISSFFN